MKHKIKMNIFPLETTVNPRLSTPRVIHFKHIWGGGLIETEGLFKRGEAYLI